MTERPPDERDEFSNPTSALDQIKQKISTITSEYSAGKLNAAQFNAMYRHYMEKRTIIERLLERNPETDAWKAASAPGKTMYLRDRFEARALYYVVFRHGSKKPLTMEGKLPQNAATQMHKLLTVLWKMESWREGLARKSLGDGMWLLLVTGKQSMTLAVFFLQPSTLQTNYIRDLHKDFERANRQSLERGLPPERMVFPQRAMMEKQS